MQSVNNGVSAERMEDVRALETFGQQTIQSHGVVINNEAAKIQESSIHVIRRFIVSTKSADGRVCIDASQVLSKKCYQQWLETRIGVTNEPERTFQRSLTAHLTGSDGRQPFLPEEEAGLLRILRMKKVWFVVFRANDSKLKVNFRK